MTKRRQRLRNKFNRSQKSKRRIHFLKEEHKEALKGIGKQGRTKNFAYNICKLYGVIKVEPKELYKSEEETLYRVLMSTYNREGDKLQYYPIIISDKRQEVSQMQVGTEWLIIGQFCTKNTESQPESFVWVANCNQLSKGTIQPGNEGCTSFVYLEGFVERKPVSTIVEGYQMAPITLQVIRKNEVADQITCMTWLGNARFARCLPTNSKIKVYGHLHSSYYESEEQVNPCEIAVDHLVRL